eukprot:scaffold40214_cov26-Tisochrysis_lutea.AAC.3
MLGGQRLERTARLAVELDEDEVPYLEHVWVVHIDEVGGVTPADAVVVQFGARSTRANIAHLPEVVLARAGEDTALGQILEPELARLLIWWQTERFVALEIGGVEPVTVSTAGADWQPPGAHSCVLLGAAMIWAGPVDGLFLEIVSKRPRAEHLEEGVVVPVSKGRCRFG